MNNEIKLVAIDLDGTLLNSRHELSDRNRSAIKSALQLGVEVVIATGKTRHAAEDLIDSLGINSPGIYMQGLITYNADGSIRTRIVMANDTVLRVISLGNELGFGALAYSDNRTFALRVDEFAIKMTEYGEPHVETIADWHELLDTIDINKVVLYGEEHQVTTLRQAIDSGLDGAVHVTRANVDGMVEILPANTSKGRAVTTLMEELGIASSNALAIGDGENDIEMLQAVSVGVAMSNATQMLKDIADVIVPSNDEDGVAVALEEYVIGEKVASK